MVSEGKANTWLEFVVNDLEKVLMPFVTSQRVDICKCMFSKKKKKIEPAKEAIVMQMHFFWLTISSVRNDK